MQLNSLDVLVILKIAAIGHESWTQTSLAADLFVAQSLVHSSLKRAEAARLFLPSKKRIPLQAVTEFMVHGVKYAFPPTRGGLTRGIPTAYAATPLLDSIVQPDTPPPVWPYAEGTVRGCEFEPIDKRAPKAAMNDEQLYELLVLIDAIRDGRPREAKMAAELLENRLAVGK